MLPHMRSAPQNLYRGERFWVTYLAECIAEIAAAPRGGVRLSALALSHADFGRAAFRLVFSLFLGSLVLRRTSRRREKI